MHYIAVFRLFATPVAKGFASVNEAVYCLERATNDPDLSPMGLYDANRNTVISYQDEMCLFDDIEETLVVRLAKSYIERIV
ncbi:hypothetical protein [Spirosoma aerophilum]